MVKRKTKNDDEDIDWEDIKWGSFTAQFEHSIGITEDGVEIFTISKKGFHKPPYF